MRIGRVMMVVFVVLTASVAVAGTYTYSPTPPDLNDLDHTYAYRWGIQTNIAPNETITGARIFFDNIYDWTYETNSLYLTLLDNASLGVTTFYDGEAGTNYFGSQGITLHRYQNMTTTPHDITYTFDATEINYLTTYAANNNIGLGFDPDCHFYNDGVTFSIDTRCPEPPPVPEPLGGSILLGGLGLLVVARRKRT